MCVSDAVICIFCLPNILTFCLPYFCCPVVEREENGDEEEGEIR